MTNSRGLIIGMVIGAVITAGLFTLMQKLIESDNDAPPPPTGDEDINITRDANPPEPPPEPPEPPQPVDDEPPPPPPPPKPPRGTPGGDTPIGNPPPPPVGPDDIGEIDLDAEPRPIYRVEPAYPVSELRKEREGEVTVEFTITEEGDVTDIRVIEATSDAFARSAVRAVAQWKYAPKIVNGQKVSRAGIRVTLEFRIAKDD
jgi:protein TonB